MKEQRLGTRDLAGTSESDVSDSEAPGESLETENNASTRQARNSATSGQMAAADEPLSRNRSESAEDDGLPENREPGFASGPTTSSHARDDTLLPGDQAERFTARWQQIQINFVDQPRASVADADTLVADLMQRLAATSPKSESGSKPSGIAAITCRRRTSASS